MHELSLAASIVDAVRREMALRPGARAISVGIRIGVMAAVDVDALEFGFRIAAENSEFPELKLVSRVISGAVICLACTHRMSAMNTVSDCEACGSRMTVLQGSDELEMESLEVEYGEDDGAVEPEADGTEREPENRREAARAL